MSDLQIDLTNVIYMENPRTGRIEAQYDTTGNSMTLGWLIIRALSLPDFDYKRIKTEDKDQVEYEMEKDQMGNERKKRVPREYSQNEAFELGQLKRRIETFYHLGKPIDIGKSDQTRIKKIVYKQFPDADTYTQVCDCFECREQVDKEEGDTYTSKELYELQEPIEFEVDLGIMPELHIDENTSLNAIKDTQRKLRNILTNFVDQAINDNYENVIIKPFMKKKTKGKKATEELEAEKAEEFEEEAEEIQTKTSEFE